MFDASMNMNTSGLSYAFYDEGTLMTPTIRLDPAYIYICIYIYRYVHHEYREYIYIYIYSLLLDPFAMWSVRRQLLQ
jgi:hypothetical protein